MYSKDAIRKGIKTYQREQEILLRLLRRYGPLSAAKFDKLFRGREYRKRLLLQPRGITGDSFILGMGVNGGDLWAFNLDLLQHMMAIDLVDTKRIDGELHYVLL